MLRRQFTLGNDQDLCAGETRIRNLDVEPSGGEKQRRKVHNPPTISEWQRQCEDLHTGVEGEAKDSGVQTREHSTDSNRSWSVEFVPRHFKMLIVSEQELDAIASGSNSLSLTFFGLCFSTAVSFCIILYNGVDQGHQSTYEMLLFAASVLSAYFGFRGGMDYAASKRRLTSLKKGQRFK